MDSLSPERYYRIKIKTDFGDITNGGQYGVTIVSLNDLDFAPNNKPIFDIICINEQTLSFRVDKIR